MGWIGPFLTGVQSASTSFVVFILSSGVWYSFGFDDSPFMISCFLLIRIPSIKPLFKIDFRKVSKFLIWVLLGVQAYITPQAHSQTLKLRSQALSRISVPGCVLFVVCSYLFGFSRGVEITRVVFCVLMDDMSFSPEGKSILRPVMEKSHKMSEKRRFFTAAAIIVAVTLDIFISALFSDCSSN